MVSTVVHQPLQAHHAWCFKESPTAIAISLVALALVVDRLVDDKTASAAQRRRYVTATRTTRTSTAEKKKMTIKKEPL
jgi:Cu/Ag efflux protein CusF